MTSSKVVVVLTEAETKALLGGVACPELPAAKEKLRAALQQEGEEAVRYRVCVGPLGEVPFLIYDDCISVTDARNIVAEEVAAEGEHPATIQKQATFTGPWVDLNDQEGEG